MGGKSHHPTRAHFTRKHDPQPVQSTRREREALLSTMLRQHKITRMNQSEIWEGIKQQHRGDPPAPVCWQFMADRRTGAATRSVA